VVSMIAVLVVQTIRDFWHTQYLEMMPVYTVDDHRTPKSLDEDRG
jgi:hypothetical protein